MCMGKFQKLNLKAVGNSIYSIFLSKSSLTICLKSQYYSIYHFNLCPICLSQHCYSSVPEMNWTYIYAIKNGLCSYQSQ